MRLVQPCRMIGCAHYKMVICDCSLALFLSLSRYLVLCFPLLSLLFLSLSLLLSLSLPSSSSPSSSSSSFSLYFFLLNKSNKPHTCPYTMASGDFDHVLHTFLYVWWPRTNIAGRPVCVCGASWCLAASGHAFAYVCLRGLTSLSFVSLLLLRLLMFGYTFLFVSLDFYF